MTLAPGGPLRRLDLRRLDLRRLVVPLISVAVGVVLVFGVLPLLDTDHTRSGHWESPLPVIVLGAITGMTYGLLAAGLVLIYRANRVINFAQGQLGAFAASLFGIAVVKWHIHYWVAFIPILVVAAGVGAIVEVAVVRRLRHAPTVMSVVATLGVGQFLVLLAFAINGRARAGASFPQPVGLPTFHVGALVVTPAYSAMLFLSPLVVITIGVFLKFGRNGLAMRASAVNPDAARMAGIFASRMSSLAWGLAAVLSAFAAILTQPTRGFTGGDTFGPSLLLIALTGAVLARLQSLPLALLAGVAIGIAEQLLLWNYADPGLVQMVLLVVIVVALLVQKQVVGRGSAKGSWAMAARVRPLPASVRALRSVRAAQLLLCTALVVVSLALPVFISDADSVRLTRSIALVIVGVSVGIITGLAGQLSLGQFAIAAIGAVVSFKVSDLTGNFPLAFFLAGSAAAVASVLIAAPSLRVKGLLVTVTTLGLALVMPSYILPKEWAVGAGVEPGRPVVFGTPIDTGRGYYYVALTTLLLALVIARNVRRSGVGRRLVAVRDNEDAARAFTVRASAVKLQGFAIAGFIAGIGGAMYGHSLTQASASSFGVQSSIQVVVLTVIGGIGYLFGPLLGAVLVEGVTFLPLDAAGLAASWLGLLIIIMYIPGGLGSLVVPIRDRFARFLARRAGIDADAAFAAEHGFGEPARSAPGVAMPRLSPLRGTVPSASSTLLEVRGLRKSFGGIAAVQGIDLELAAGETLGLIGPNGAGKTTTFEMIAGFTTPDAGAIAFGDTDITTLRPEARAQLGLIRSFQDAALFPTLTVVECVQLSLERGRPTQFLRSVLGLRRQDVHKRALAESLVSWMGLERYGSSEIQELSTGTRRIAEIACVVGLQPTLLLLDEPSSGVAQRETEALGVLLAKLRSDLGLTMIVIEHDIPLIMDLADRIVCMADGAVIANGRPAAIRNDPAVIDAYLGGSLEAIERSTAPRRPATVDL